MNDIKEFMSENKNVGILASAKTKRYLLSYMIVLAVIFILPMTMLLFSHDLTLLGANLLFFEVNMFLFLVLMVYTYITRSENKNWKMYTYSFILSLSYLIITFLVFSMFM
jgi:hypothetical protein